MNEQGRRGGWRGRLMPKCFDFLKSSERALESEVRDLRAEREGLQRRSDRLAVEVRELRAKEAEAECHEAALRERLGWGVAKEAEKECPVKGNPLKPL